MGAPNNQIIQRMLDVIEDNIVPLTEAGVEKGNKLFGAAILLKSDLSLVIAGSNNEVENPLWHGEIATLKAFYELPASERPAPQDCLFLATHEPCSLCLSGITWTGFDNFYFLFGYEDTRDSFNIPHDLKILQEVFKIENGDYARQNAFWQSHNLNTMITQLPENEITKLSNRVKKISMIYDELSNVYQKSKGDADIPLS